ncbi:MAG: DNA polymerase III subunit gamma/tau [Calothrix sp. C42_A2020_038]|nr:DNA polymerase III subunit gamma/tau [Calothrix sp. C42_A2020_038]
MSYEPLHHKYRPKSFAELVGQQAIATTLTNAINTSRIAPAYLFTGPRGTGKTSSARILAKSLNCLSSSKPTATPCGVCDVCQGITKGYTVDVIEIDAASNTGVENVRDIIEKAQFAPVQCRYKVYVIDECHMLSVQAFNALLKTLEEPPKHIVFVLATTDPQRVLPTIISRCQRFDFRRIPLESMVAHLTEIAIKENINITTEAITLVAQLSQGGLRDAESLLDQLSLLPEQINPNNVWDLVGTVSEHDLYLLLKAITANDAEALIGYTRKILDRGREPLTILQNLAGFYRDLLIAKTAKNRGDLVACTQQTWQALVELAQYMDISLILTGQQHLRGAEVQLKNTSQPRLWLEITLLGLLPCAQQQILPSNNTANTATVFTPQPSSNNNSNNQLSVNQSANNHQVQVEPQAKNHKSSTQNHQPQTSNQQNDLTQTWQQVLSYLEPVSRRELLRQMCNVIDIRSETARLGVRQAWHKRVQEDLPIITKAFKATFNREIIVNLEIIGSSTLHSIKEESPTYVTEDSGKIKTIESSQVESPQSNSSNGKLISHDANNLQNTASHQTKETLQNHIAQNHNLQNNLQNNLQKNGLPSENASSNITPPSLIKESLPKPDVNTTNGNGRLEAQEIVPENTQPTIALPTTSDADVEKVWYAAERLAQFFDGQIIGYNEDAAEFSDAASSDLIDVVESDDD